MNRLHTDPQQFYWIALLQKIVMVLLVLNIILWLTLYNFEPQDNFRSNVLLTVITAALGLVIFVSVLPVCSLCWIIYRPFPGVVIGLLCMIPCLGWLIQFSLIRECNHDLRHGGFEVGLFGAKLSEINERIEKERKH